MRKFDHWPMSILTEGQLAMLTFLQGPVELHDERGLVGLFGTLYTLRHLAPARGWSSKHTWRWASA